jgi:hypothetical protein
VRPVGDEHAPPVPLPPLGGPGLELLGGPLRQGAQDGGGEATAGVAGAGGVGRAGRLAAGGAVGDDSRHSVVAAMILGEDLGEEAPEGGGRAEDPVAVPDAVFLEGVMDPRLGQDVSERAAVVAREASVELLPARRVVGSGVSGRGDRDPLGRVGLAGAHSLYYDGAKAKVHFVM